MFGNAEGVVEDMWPLPVHLFGTSCAIYRGNIIVAGGDSSDTNFDMTKVPMYSTWSSDFC